MSNVVQSYNAGAWTALTKMVERGAKKDTILAVAEDMGITVDDMDDADRAIMTQKFGEPFGTPGKVTLSDDEVAKILKSKMVISLADEMVERFSRHKSAYPGCWRTKTREKMELAGLVEPYDGNPNEFYLTAQGVEWYKSKRPGSFLK